MRRTAGRVITLIVGVLSITVLAGVAWASIPGPDGVIHACYKPSDGKLFVVDSAASCPSGSTALNWNQTGPAGPAGPPGPGLQRVLSTQHFDATPSRVGRFFGPVSCPAGMQAINAGLWEISAEQAWVNAVTSDPNYPDVSAANARSTFYEGVDPGVNGAPSGFENPPTRYGDVTADGTGWIFNYGINLPWYDPTPTTNPDDTIAYGADVTVWVACVQPDN
jgi:hypothetical protein